MSNIDGTICACYTQDMKIAIKSFLLCTLCLVVVSCMSVPKTMPKDMTSAELTQRAQEFLDKKNYKAAAFVYKTLEERFGNDIAIYVSARFEIAHIYIKQKKWKQAYEILNEINAYYIAGDVQGLSAEYSKLIQIDLQKIPEKYRLEAEVSSKEVTAAVEKN